MKVFYFRSSDSAAAGVLEQHAEHAAGMRTLRDPLDSVCRREAMIDLLAAGDVVVAPSARHLADTGDGVVAVARRIAARGARLSLLREGIDGDAVVRVADALGRLGGALEPLSERRPYRRATPEAVGEIVRLSAARRSIAHIALAVGLSVSTVNRVRQRHRAGWANGGMAHAAE